MEYIQLPPIKRGTDPQVVESVWKFVQLSKESQDIILQKLENIYDCKEETEVKEITVIQKEEIQEFESIMRSIISQMLLESCDLACWVYHHKYILDESLETMITLKPAEKDLIMILDAMSTQYMHDKTEEVTS